MGGIIGLIATIAVVICIVGCLALQRRPMKEKNNSWFKTNGAGAATMTTSANGANDLELANLQRLTVSNNVQNAMYDLPMMDRDLMQIPRILSQDIKVGRRIGQGAFGTVYKGILRGNPVIYNIVPASASATATTVSSTVATNSTAAAANQQQPAVTSPEEQPTPQPEMEVALKELTVDAKDKAREDFAKEAKTLNSFSHENIVSLIGVCLDNNRNFLVMEFMANGDLLSYLRACRPSRKAVLAFEAAAAAATAGGGQAETPPGGGGWTALTTRDLAEMCLDVVKGCAYLESEKFVHRDIAARNCLVSEGGGGHRGSGQRRRIVKIGDFGMARDVYRNDYYRMGEGVKIPVRWLPPESLRDGVFTSKTDVWAFGVLLWEILTLGEQPYPARNHLEVMSFVCDKGTLDKPKNCPPALSNLMDRCWSYMPEERPSFLDCLSTIQELMLVLPPCQCCQWPLGGAVTASVTTSSSSDLSEIKMHCHSAPGQLVPAQKQPLPSNSWRTTTGSSSFTNTTLPLESTLENLSEEEMTGGAVAMPFPPDVHPIDSGSGSGESPVPSYPFNSNLCQEVRSHTSNPEQSASFPIYLGPLTTPNGGDRRPGDHHNYLQLLHGSNAGASGGRTRNESINISSSSFSPSQADYYRRQAISDESTAYRT